jgi:ParB-like chromosome segregation protein Spo0J
MTEIVERATKDLVPYARNPRKNDAVVDQMAASIREFGFKVPILALSDGTIVDGHLRLKAAQKLRIVAVPVILCDEWTPAQVKAFRLMANKSVAWAEWDTELLRFEMEGDRKNKMAFRARPGAAQLFFHIQNERKFLWPAVLLIVRCSPDLS